MKGILNLHKESGMSSASAVAKARRILQTRAIGHMGTLDPQGTGVLLAGVGKATRLFDFYLNKDKEYQADFAFGYTTDTLDPEGAITATTAVIPTKQAIENALAALCGTYPQMPPLYSAKSIGGVRAYELARRGEIPDVKPSTIRVDEFTLIQQKSDTVYRFHIRCSSGTYIRSLCRDLAESLNSLACMTAIHRSRTGTFTDKAAVTLAQLEVQGASALLSVEDALAHLPCYEADESLYQKILSGIKLDAPDLPEPFTVYCKGELFGLGKSAEGKLKIPTFLKD